MRKVSSHLKKWLVAAIAVNLAPFAFAYAAYAVDADPHLERRTVNLGLIHSIAVPVVWKVDAVANSTGSEIFVKDGKDLWDCSQRFEVCAPVHAEAGLLRRLNELTKLSNQLSAADLGSIKALACFGEFSNNKVEVCIGTVYGVNGRRVVVVEQRGKRIGVCQPMTGGGSRRTLISYVAGVVYIPVGEETLQAVKFVSEVMGDYQALRASDSKYVEEH